MILSVVFFVACADSHAPVRPDSAPPPLSPAGHFAITSELDLASGLPGPTGDWLAGLRAATDGADDPARFLIDRLIAELPEGRVKTAATYLAPFLASYLQQRIADVAPGLVPGIDALASGLERAAHRMGTVEQLDVAPDGTATRTLRGLRFPPDTRGVTFGEMGLADLSAATHVSITEAFSDVGAPPSAAGSGHTLAIAEHSFVLPPGTVLTLALDRSVIPSVDPGAVDLAHALADLVDCDRLGAMLAETINAGAPELYAGACRFAMTTVASECYARLAALDATPATFAMTGTARALDPDTSGTLDAIDQGIWTGTIESGGARVSLGTATFTGTRAP